jgi:hypothetical protein
VDPSTIVELLDETTLTMYLFKKVFSMSFFDVMTHLPIHLEEQLDICGPRHTIWMYPMERYLKALKGYVRSEHSQKTSWHRAT